MTPSPSVTATGAVAATGCVDPGPPPQRLSAYAGQTVVVAITNKDDNYPGDATYTFVDDVSVLQNQAPVPWKDPATVTSGNNTPWGDYEGMAAAQDGTGAFIPAWGDNRNDPQDGGAGRTQVFATQWVLP